MHMCMLKPLKRAPWSTNAVFIITAWSKPCDTVTDSILNNSTDYSNLLPFVICRTQTSSTIHQISNWSVLKYIRHTVYLTFVKRYEVYSFLLPAPTQQMQFWFLDSYTQSKFRRLSYIVFILTMADEHGQVHPDIPFSNTQLNHWNSYLFIKSIDWLSVSDAQ